MKERRKGKLSEKTETLKDQISELTELDNDAVNAVYEVISSFVAELQKLRDTTEISVFHSGEIHAYEKVLRLIGEKENQK